MLQRFSILAPRRRDKPTPQDWEALARRVAERKGFSGDPKVEPFENELPETEAGKRHPQGWRFTWETDETDEP